MFNFINKIIGKDIGELNLSNNNLRTIPPDIRRLTQLVKLDLSRNGLRCLHSQDYTGLPAEMSQLISLQTLRISECNLPFIPPVIWKLTSLQVKYLLLSLTLCNTIMGGLCLLGDNKTDVLPVFVFAN